MDDVEVVLSMCIPLQLDDGVAQTNIIEYLSVTMSGQTDFWLTVRGMSISLMVDESPQRAILIQLAFTHTVDQRSYGNSINHLLM